MVKNLTRVNERYVDRTHLLFFDKS